jgi:hypothetical protein
MIREAYAHQARAFLCTRPAVSEPDRHIHVPLATDGLIGGQPPAELRALARR